MNIRDISFLLVVTVLALVMAMGVWGGLKFLLTN